MKIRLHRVLAILCVFLIFQNEGVFASTVSKPNIKVSVGYQNYFDPREWVPVQITVTSNQKRPLSGKLLFVINPQFMPFDGTLIWNVPHSTSASRGIQSASLTVGIPGLFIKNGGEIIWENTRNQIIARSHLPGIAINGSEIAGVVSQSPESVQVLAGVSSNSGSSELVTAYIPPKSLAASMPLLESLSYLYVDGAAASLLNSLQTQAILNWVRAGGVLIFGGIQPNAGQIGRFLRQSPVVPRIVLDKPPNQIADFAGSTGIHSNESLLYGNLSPGAQVLVGSPKQALVGVKSLGRGKVVYVGFNAASPDFVSWSGNAQFWDTLFHTLRTQALSSRQDLFGSNGLWGLYSAAEQFPQLHAPPLWIWEVVFGVYVFAVGPVLYFLLRRRRRNEWAWGYLPVISILMALGIYELGVMQRPNGILTQSVGLVDIYDKGLAQITGVEAFMSPQSRTYSVQTPKNTWSVPMIEQATGNATSQSINEFTSQMGKITFNRVNAWGGRFIFSLRLTRNLGYIQGEIYREGKSVAGYLHNDSKLDYTDSALILKNQVISIGPLKSGQSVNISALLHSSELRSNLAATVGAVLSSATHGVGKSLFDNANHFANSSLPADAALFVAWSHEDPNIFIPEGSVLPATPQWFVRELMTVTQVKE